MHTLFKPVRYWRTRLCLALLAGSLCWQEPQLAVQAKAPRPAFSIAPGALTVTTFAADCARPQTSYGPGAALCAQVLGIDPAVTKARFDLVDPDGVIQQSSPVITADGQTTTFVLPANGALAKLGAWRINIAYSSDSSVAATTPFNFITCPTFSFSPATLPGGAVGTAYNQTIAADPAGGNYNYALTTGALPPGLSLNGTTGALTGTPATGGSYAFGITATGFGTCVGAQSYSLLITATCGTLTLAPTALPVGQQGAAYSQTISATGGVAPYTFSVSSGALPGGLTLDANSGVLSGTPTATGSFAITIRATGQGGCTGQRSYLLTINCATVTIDTALPNPVKSVAYSQTLTASPAGTYTFNVLIGGLPPGLTLSSAGVLSGVVSTSGTYTFTVRARTVSGCQGTRAYTLTIS